MRRPLSTIAPRRSAQRPSTFRRLLLGRPSWCRSAGPLRRAPAGPRSDRRPDERLQHLGRRVHHRARPVPHSRGGGARPGRVRVGEVRGARAAHRLDGSAVPRRQRRPRVPHPGPGAAQRCRVGRVLPRRRRSGDAAGQRADAAHGADRADGGHRGQGDRYRPGRSSRSGSGSRAFSRRPGSGTARDDSAARVTTPGKTRAWAYLSQAATSLGPGVVLGGLGDHRRPSGGPDARRRDA